MTQTTEGAPAGPVDWEFAKATGARLVPPGPRVSASEAVGVVASVRQAAARAQQPVADTARLHAPGTAPAALVVDRPTWITLNADSMAAMVDPVFAELVGKRRQQPSAAVAAVGGKVTGGEAGALLAFMASKVLGQYDLAPAGSRGCCSSPPTSSTSSASSGWTRRTSGSGCACTRRPTGCSSPRCPGCAST